MDFANGSVPVGRAGGDLIGGGDGSGSRRGRPSSSVGRGWSKWKKKVEYKSWNKAASE